MNIYEICEMVIKLEAYNSKDDYQKRLDIFLAIQGLTLEEYTELTELLKAQ